MKIIRASYTIEQWPTDALAHIERIGRVCYKSEDRIDDGMVDCPVRGEGISARNNHGDCMTCGASYGHGKIPGHEPSALPFARKILKLGHESVIEHASMSVRFIVDRGVSHELVRHRLAAFSQESTRYCNYGKSGEVTFIEPCFGWIEGSTLQRDWIFAMQQAEHTYLRMLGAGASPQEARSVLPNSLKTEIVMTCNLREWRHVFKLRTPNRAHPQMREVMVPLLAECKLRIPVLFDDIEATP